MQKIKIIFKFNNFKDFSKIKGGATERLLATLRLNGKKALEYRRGKRVSGDTKRVSVQDGLAETPAFYCQGWEGFTF